MSPFDFGAESDGSNSQQRRRVGSQCGRYSNTNYLLLSLVLEHVWGRTFAQLVDERISAPLGLQLRALTPREQPALLALAHDAQNQVLSQPGLSSLVGAGNLVASAVD